MSQSRGNIEENPELESALDKVQRWYHIPTVLVLIGFMLWNRLRNYSNFIVDGGVVFSGQDPWYHYRSTMYVVRNWPATMPFDPWTYFPVGNSSGQFGTLLDQVVGTVALIVGLGSPSEQTVGMVAIAAPAVLGALAAIPTYYLGRRLGGRIGGVTAVVVLALSAGTFLARSLVGVYDHQVAEGLLQVLSVLAVMVAVSVAERDKPVYEQFLERDVPSLRATVGYSVLAGFAIAMYLWTWPPAVLLLGILGTFFLVYLTAEFVRGKSPEHVAIAGAVMMGSVTIFSLAVINSFTITATDHSLLQVLLAFSIGAGCVFMAWLARYMEAEEYDRSLYPVTVGGIIVTVTVLMAILTPDLLGYFTDQLLRVVGFTSSPSATTTSVGEATPLRDPSRLYGAHGLSLFVAVIGAALVLFRQLFDRDAPAEQLLVVIWAAFITAATFTQIRFGVYFVFPVATLTGLAVSYVVDWTEFSVADGVEVYEVIMVAAIGLTIVGTLFMAPTAMAVGDSASPGQEPAAWGESLDWMQENTPQEGAYGTGGERSLEYYGTYQNREDFDYEEGEYGVMSWWDYGHMITVMGERVPNANPFQQGSTQAANFLLAPNETQANDVLNRIDEDDAKTRYVAVDWKMANVYGGYSNGKFFAPPRFYDVSNVSASDYYRQIINQQNGIRSNYRTQKYYNSTVVRLYEYHGSAVEPRPLVLDWEIQTQNGRQFRGLPSDGPAVRQFETMEQARAYVQEDGTSQVGGFGSVPSERVPAMEHYRFVGSSERNAYQSSAHNTGVVAEALNLGLPIGTPTNGNCGSGQTKLQSNFRGQLSTTCLPNGATDLLSANNPAWTKIFERVPGATVEGTGPANTTVEASVRMRNHQTNETFIYRQQTRTDENGNFEMVVPYSTTGYDEWGTDEGYTNVSVRAETQYQFTASDGSGVPQVGTTDVTEGQVIGENESAATVELEPIVDPERINTEEPTNGSSLNTTDTNGSVAAPVDG